MCRCESCADNLLQKNRSLLPGAWRLKWSLQLTVDEHKSIKAVVMCNKVMTIKLPLLRQTLALHISIRSYSVKERINTESRDNKHDTLQQKKKGQAWQDKKLKENAEIMWGHLQWIPQFYQIQKCKKSSGCASREKMHKLQTERDQNRNSQLAIFK